MIDESAIRLRYKTLSPVLDESSRRRFGAAEAIAAGRGGVSAVMRATGLARSTIGRGLAELRRKDTPDGRVRRPGGGRKPFTMTDARLLEDCARWSSRIAAAIRSRPCSGRARACANSARACARWGIGSVARWSANCCTSSITACKPTARREGSSHPDRDAQFRYINDRMKEAIASGEPAISVDTKKKELVGDFKNGGREWRPKGTPEQVRVHDFVIKELGRAVPYGVYDIADNTGWVSVGIDRDTAAFAANAIRNWWMLMGRERYPRAKRLLISADDGGSNGSRVRLWKVELQKLADELGIPITACRLPPGTSKWNKIEHRLFSFITQNWRGKPLVSYRTIVQLIAATTTDAGLKVRCQLDQNAYPVGIKVSDAEFDAVNLTRHDFHANGTIQSVPNYVPWSASSRTGP